MLQKQMKKVYRNNEFIGSYVIGVGKNDEVDEAKFKENISEDDKKKCDVMILFLSEYDDIIHERDSLRQQVKDLKSANEDMDNQIKQLNEKLDENNRYYIDKVTQSSKELNKEFSDKIASVTTEKQSEIDDLKGEASAMEVRHVNEIHALDSKYKNTLIRLRTEDNNDIADFNKKTSRIIADLKDLGFFEKHTSKFDKTISELTECIDEFEKTNKNKLLAIDEDFPKIKRGNVDEDSEANE